MAEIDLTVDVDEAAVEAALRQERCRRLLAAAPELIEHVRSLGISGDGERGETLPEWSSPMRVTPVDGTDEAYAQLLNWVSFFAEEFGVKSPAVTVAWKIRRGDVWGFRAGTTPQGAWLLVKSQTLWLLTHEDRIARHPSGPTFHDDVAEFLGKKLQSLYPMVSRGDRAPSQRPCPACGSFAVNAEWDWEANDLWAVTVRCGVCGFQVPTPSRGKLVEWIAEEPTIETYVPALWAFDCLTCGERFTHADKARARALRDKHVAARKDDKSHRRPSRIRGTGKPFDNPEEGTK